tara:strand:- start:467 stop:2269 length:1803 start_codon:yes stop_codon:yes gene_type:complete
MELALIASGIKATMRAAQAGVNLYSEKVRDKPIFLPNIKLAALTKQDEISLFLRNSHHTEWQVEAPFSSGWSQLGQAWQSEDSVEIETVFSKVIALKLKETAQTIDKNKADLLVGGRMIEQWRTGNEPPTMWSRIALTITDIGLEFVSAYPAVLGEESRGEKLLVSFATNLNQLIPDDTADMGKRHDFQDRVVGIFVRAGLTSLTENSQSYFEDEDIRTLFKGVVKPLIDATPDDFLEQYQNRQLVDALLGPAAAAAMDIVAKKPDKYLGNKFTDDKALGLITMGFFNAAKVSVTEGSITDVFSKEGATTLYKSVLQVAIDKPSLFVTVDDPQGQFTQDLFVGVAKIFKERTSATGISQDLGLAISSLVIDTAGNHAHTLLKLDASKPWDKVSIELIDDITDALVSSIDAGERIEMFSEQQLYDYTRVVLEQVALTPVMLGIEGQEVKAIFSGIATAMASDNNLLLSEDEWIYIAGVAAGQAAANPARLFGLDEVGKATGVGVSVITSILTVASQHWSIASPTPMVGKTLTAALEIVIDALAGNIQAVTGNPQLIEHYFNNLMGAIEASPEIWGSETILGFIEESISDLLVNGNLPTVQS